MLYQTYQAYADVTDPVRSMAKAIAKISGKLSADTTGHTPAQRVAAAYELMALAGLSHSRPPYGIASVTVNGRETAVSEDIVHRTPFCSLLRFRKDPEVAQPRVLVVAPLSGHFATLLRATVRTMLPDHDVYLTDWHNVRDVPLMEGRFDLDDFVDHVIGFLEAMGPGAHVVAVCQPTVAVLAAASLMAADRNPAQAASMTLMAGPIDTRVNPTKVNELAQSKPIEWFEQNLIGTVPWRYAGALRRVYPGFVQLAAFMSMNLERHAKSFLDLRRHLEKGDVEKAEPILTFYHEYFAMMDLPAEFYLQTIRAVFQEHLLPLGRLTSRGRLVEPARIRKTALLTVEGEKDDICAIGQTLAAQDMCSGLMAYRKEHHVQAGVGHYGVFNGRRWEQQIYPRVREFIHSHD
jgi:polyhydroxyalkanoate depolymerase